MIGPRPPAPGDAALSAAEASAREIEERARRMRDRLEGRDKQVRERGGVLVVARIRYLTELCKN